jgi:hypothetical protein
MTYRSDLDALAARQAALETEVADRQRDLAQTRQMLDEARARARLPVLDNIGIAAPCTADWNKMTGDERARHCGDCNLTVYNLSGMARDEAETLLREREGRLCVRYYQRSDGTILLKDCTVGVKRRRRRRIAAAAVAGSLASVAGVAAYAFLPPAVMGEVETVGVVTHVEQSATPEVKPPEAEPEVKLIPMQGQLATPIKTPPAGHR